MYASVRRWKADASKTEDAARRLEEGLLPDLRRIEGFVACYFVKRDDGEAATVSIFRDRRGLEESSRLATAFVDRELRDVAQGPPEVLEGHVAVHALSQAPGSQEPGMRATPGPR